MSIERSEKVATPFTAATVFVPLKVPEDGFVPIARVTEAEEFTRLPFASRTSTFTAGAIADPAVVFDGWTLKGAVAATFVGGRLVFANDEVTGTDQLLKRLEAPTMESRA